MPPAPTLTAEAGAASRPARWRASAAWLVFALGIILSLFAGKFAHELAQDESRQQFDDLIVPAQAAIEQRISAYAGVLEGLQGLFVASDTVDRRTFRRYVSHLDLPQRFPGMKAVTFIRRVADDERAGFEAKVRADRSADPAGYADFAVRPAGARPVYYVIEYAEPAAENRRLPGLDLGAEPGRLPALELARDAGWVVASGSLKLLADAGGQADFALRVPIYANGKPHFTIDQRRAHLLGMVGVVVHVDDMLRDLLSEQVVRQVRLRIYDKGARGDAHAGRSGEENRLFDSAAADPAADPAALTTVRTIDVGGRAWELHFTAREALQHAVDSLFPKIIMLAGLLVSALFAGLLLSFVGSHRRALVLAGQMTGRLRESEASLAEAQRIAHLGNWTYDAASGRVAMSDEALRIAGLNAAAGGACYTDCMRRIHRDDRRRLWEMVRCTLTYGRGDGIDLRIVERGGRVRWAQLAALPAASAAGNERAVHGTLADITERKRGDLRRAMEHAVGRLLTEAESLAAVTPRLIAGICATLDWDCGARWSWDAARQSFACHETWSVAEPAVEAFIARVRDDFVPGPDGLLRRVAGSGEPLWVSDIAHDPRSVRAAAAARSGLHGAVAFPVLAGDSVVGVMEFFCREIAAPDDDLIAALRAIGVQLGQFCRRKAAEEALRNSEERLHGIVNMANEAIMAVDEEFNIVLFNPAAEKMFGCPAAEAIGSGVDRFIPAHLRAGHRHHMTRFTTVGESGRKMGERMQVNALRGNGEEFPVEASIAKLTHSGQPLYSVILNDVSDRKRDEERLKFLANYDPLTALPNRALFNQRLQRALGHAQRLDTALAVLFIDLDRFKIINDTLGHEAGDSMLQEVARRLTGCLREIDLVARLGGDEFVVLIEQLADVHYASGIAQKVIQAVAAPFTLGGNEYHVTASVGISTYPADGIDGATLLKNADIAMYRAKEQGKNNFQFYAAQMNVHTVAKLSLESGLRRALERDEFLLHYQPKVDLRSGRIVGMEALIRWQRPESGMVQPAHFIPLAEETGLIVPIGEWALLTACRCNRAWQLLGMRHLRVAVNLSARQFAQPGLVREVARILEVTGLDAASLELEITESMVMGNPDQARQTLHEFKEMGIALALDDFGTGYSSLGYLRRFPLDHIKIDRSFLRDIPDSADDVILTRTIIAMAHGLRLKVVAEGVETEAQYRFLRAEGCDEMQGYYFSRPVAADEFRALVCAEHENVARIA